MSLKKACEETYMQRFKIIGLLCDGPTEYSDIYNAANYVNCMKD